MRADRHETRGGIAALRAFTYADTPRWPGSLCRFFLLVRAE